MNKKTLLLIFVTSIMDRLADELLSLIFSHVTDKNTLLTCVAVCPIWQRILCDARYWTAVELNEKEAMCLLTIYGSENMLMVRCRTYSNVTGEALRAFHYARHLTYRPWDASTDRVLEHVSPHVESLDLMLSVKHQPTLKPFLPDLTRLSFALTPYFTNGFELPPFYWPVCLTEAQEDWLAAWILQLSGLRQLTCQWLQWTRDPMASFPLIHLSDVTVSEMTETFLDKLLERNRAILTSLRLGKLHCLPRPISRMNVLFRGLARCPNLKRVAYREMLNLIMDHESLASMVQLEDLDITVMDPVPLSSFPPRLKRVNLNETRVTKQQLLSFLDRVHPPAFRIHLEGLDEETCDAMERELECRYLGIQVSNCTTAIDVNHHMGDD